MKRIILAWFYYLKKARNRRRKTEKNSSGSATEQSVLQNGIFKSDRAENQPAFNRSLILSAIMAINSELVGLPLDVCIV